MRGSEKKGVKEREGVNKCQPKQDLRRRGKAL
jgi:hypothetical protein